MPVTDTSDKKVVRISYIYYPIRFQEGQEQVQTFLNSGSKVNAMIPAFDQKLGLHNWKMTIKAQKIDGSALEIFEMVIADLEMKYKAGRSRFFQEIFLRVDTKFEAVLEMLFLKISNTDVGFGKETLTWKSYTTNEALPSTEQVQLVDPKEFIKQRWMWIVRYCGLHGHLGERKNACAFYKAGSDWGTN